MSLYNESLLPQLKSVLSYSNTPMLASLKIWKQNLDQKYQGVEPCYICYCIMHNTSFTMPTSQCRTCKNKYHSSCLVSYRILSAAYIALGQTTFNPIRPTVSSGRTYE